MAAINKRKLLESAQKNLQKGALDKALKDYQELLAADPRDANVRLKVGDLQLKRGNGDEAIAAYLKVADQFMRDGFDAKAVAIYKQVTKIDAKRFDIYIPLADLYQRLGLINDAMAALQTAAEAYQRDGRRREALDLLRRMASLDPTNTTSRLKVAELLHQEQLTQEAIAEFEEAAAELDRQGDWEARAGVLQRLLDIAPDRAEAYDALIALWIERHQPGRAEPLARKLVALDPQRAESQETLADVLRARGNEQGAIEAYRAAAEAWRARGDEERARAIVQRHIPSELFGAAGGTPNGAITNPITESPFGEEGIGGEPPPAADEFRFVDDGEPAPLGAEADDDFELELDDAPQPALAEADVAPPAPPAAAATPARVAAPAPAAAPAAKPAPAPAAASDSPEQLGRADVEQLLAEAAVYLRYGKHERARASLEGALAQQPHHLGALELLGEAYLRGENGAEAVAIWTRAHDLAADAGDTEKASALRARIEAVDPGAAPAGEPPPHARAAAAATVLFDAPAPPASETPAEDDETGDFGEIEIDVEEPEYDAAGEASERGAEALVFEEAAGATPSAAHEPDANEDSIAGAGFEIEIGASEPEPVAEKAGALSQPGIEASAAELSQPGVDAIAAEPTAPEAFELPEESEAPGPFELSEESPAPDPAAGLSFESQPETPEAGFEATPASVAQVPAAPPASASAPPQAAELSSSTSQQIVEDLEEASFYFEQGLLDEAEAIYRRVVERAPNHPGALLRLGEIAAARGEDPGRAAREVGAPAAPADAVEGDAEGGGATIDPPDDLDLTAREFGPGRAWDDDETTSGDPIEESTGSFADAAPPTDAQLEATDPGDWTTPDTTEPTPAVAEEAAAAPPEPTPPTPEAVAAERTPAPEPALEPPPLELTAPEIASEEDGAPAFDLAAELSEALRDEASAPASGGATDEDGFAALFREFKRGVSRTLGEADVETHFDLGIAYREMGLLDDAIGEFRYALGSGARRLDALHMMGLCALDVGRPADAVGHLEQALASPDVPADREAPLRYDLARAYEAHGDRERAIDAFARVVDLDAAFQDAAERLAALRADAPAAEPPAPEEAGEAEAYESFDDLIAQAADEGEAAAAAPVVEESYESFDEFQSDDDEAPAAEDAVEPKPEPLHAAPAEAEPVEVEVAPPPPEPAPSQEPPRRRRKISFF